MKAKILDGRKVAEEMFAEMKGRLRGRGVKLAVVQVGENAVSAKYVARKKQAAQELGIAFEHARFDERISQAELEREVRALGESAEVSGLVVQFPLPKHIRAQEVLDQIPPQKDVDVLSSAAFEKFRQGRLAILPPTVAALRELFFRYGIELRGKKILLVGMGRLVGMPLAAWLKNEGIVFQTADKRTGDLPALMRKADVVISGVGKARLITGDMVKEGVVVIDAGTSVEAGHTKGDVDFASVAKKASWITPVPGGVGPLTVACLLRNLVRRVQ